VPLEELVVILFAVQTGLVDSAQPSGVAALLQKGLDWLRQHSPQVRGLAYSVGVRAGCHGVWLAVMACMAGQTVWCSTGIRLDEDFHCARCTPGRKQPSSLLKHHGSVLPLPHLLLLLRQVLTGIASSKQLTAKGEKGVREAFAAVLQQ
jgi:hypothetical protein